MRAGAIHIRQVAGVLSLMFIVGVTLALRPPHSVHHNVMNYYQADIRILIMLTVKPGYGDTVPEAQ